MMRVLCMISKWYEGKGKGPPCKHARVFNSHSLSAALLLAYDGYGMGEL